LKRGRLMVVPKGQGLAYGTDSVVVVGLEVGEVGGSEGSGDEAGGVAAVVERDPVAVREVMVAFNT